MTDPIVLTVSRDIAAPPDRIFDAWLDPDIARHFLFATPDGEMLTCEIDARVGGRGLIVERRATGDAHHRILFEELVRPGRIVFLFAADPAAEGQWTRVTIEIAPTLTGSRVTLTHMMDPAWTAYEEQTRRGWTMILDSLSRTIGEER
ncbi:MAG TPA: SRPBCC domain-containing protein [Sphingomonas sp.]